MFFGSCLVPKAVLSVFVCTFHGTPPECSAYLFAPHERLMHPVVCLFPIQLHPRHRALCLFALYWHVTERSVFFGALHNHVRRRSLFVGT